MPARTPAKIQVYGSGVTKVPSSDEDMLDPWKDAASRLSGGRRAEGTEATLKRGRDLAVDMDALRQLLDDQSRTLMQAQERAVSQAILGLEERHGKALDLLMVQQEKHTAGLRAVETQLFQQHRRPDDLAETVQEGNRELEARIAKLEQTRSNAESTVTETTDDNRYRNVLIFGGWPRDTKRQIILNQLNQGMQSLKLEEHMNGEPYTTGPRKTVAFLRFKRRGHESDADTKARMHLFVKRFQETMVLIKDSGDPARKIWCSYSKSPQQRRSMDVEYSSGTVWMGCHRLASAALLPDPQGLGSAELDQGGPCSSSVHRGHAPSAQ